MWQRIQTLYLAVSTALMITLFFSVKAAVYAADGSAIDEITYCSFYIYVILLVVIVFLNILALTTWKKLVFQFRTTVLAALVTFALQLWLVVDWLGSHDAMVFRFTAVFPIVAVILDTLAARGILADLFLVESVNRLRDSRKKKGKN